MCMTTSDYVDASSCHEENDAVSPQFLFGPGRNELPEPVLSLQESVQSLQQ